MRRREFITFFVVVATWPLKAGAQQQAMPVIGYLSAGSPDSLAANLAAFQQGLAETGIVEVQNVRIEYRWSRDEPERLRTFATDLVGRNVAILYAVSNFAAFAAKSATSTIPIVFLAGGDPVEIGLVASLNRPDANATGVTLFLNELSAKRLELLNEIVPNVPVVAFMVNPTNPRVQVNIRELQAAALGARQEILILSVSHERKFEAAFATLIQRNVGALLIDGDILFNDQRDRLIHLAARHRVPASYQVRESAIAGGLMSYGPSVPDGSSWGLV